MTSTSNILFIALLLLLSACSQPEQEAVPAPDSLAVAQPVLPDSLSEQLAALQVMLQSIEHQQDSIKAAFEAIAAPAAVLPANSDTTSQAARAQTRDNVLENAGEAIQNFGFRFFIAVSVVLLAWYLVRGTIFLLERRAEKNAERRLFYKRLVPIARITLWTLTILFVVRGIFQVDAQAFLAAATAIGVAVGFAAQDVMKNIFGGLVIIFDQPFQVGDKISVAGTYGEVSSIGLRSTRIVTPDDNLVSVPNAQVVDGQVSNANAGALDCQVVTDMFLPGWIDEARAKELAYQAAASSKYVYLKKPIVVLVKDVFDNTFLTRIRVKAYVLDIRYEFALMSDVTERARAAFREEGLIQPTYGARPIEKAMQSGHRKNDTEVIAAIGDDIHKRKDA